jgi:exodeoxyribonuclease VII small subunit
MITPMTRSRRPTNDPLKAGQNEAGALEHSPNQSEAAGADLNYNQARTALELILTQLQASDLDIEAMAGLYQRGQAYARRCEAILEEVEQEVLLWDGLNEPESSPKPLEPARMERSRQDEAAQT